jgi:hypothetical protein
MLSRARDSCGRTINAPAASIHQYAGHSRYNDQVDALSQALKRAFAPLHVAPVQGHYGRRKYV